MAITLDRTEARDKLNETRHLIDAVWLASVGIGDTDYTNAIQVVCREADRRLEDVLKMLESAS